MFVDLYSRNCAAQRILCELKWKNLEWTTGRSDEQGALQMDVIIEKSALVATISNAD